MSHAEVLVAGESVASIGNGLLVLVGVEGLDTEAIADGLLERIVTYRVFADDSGKMNRDLREEGGGLLLVPQFTLAADTSRGRRPGFSRAAAPEVGRALFDYLVNAATGALGNVAAGRFGAAMQVKLTNEGPVTFWLQVSPE